IQSSATAAAQIPIRTSTATAYRARCTSPRDFNKALLRKGGQGDAARVRQEIHGADNAVPGHAAQDAALKIPRHATRAGRPAARRRQTRTPGALRARNSGHDIAAAAMRKGKALAPRTLSVSRCALIDQAGQAPP